MITPHSNSVSRSAAVWLLHSRPFILASRSTAIWLHHSRLFLLASRSTALSSLHSRFFILASRSAAVWLLATLSILHAPCSVSAQIPSYVPTNGLVGWWPFNGNANDESGNGNNGTVNGATLTTDRFGVANKAFSFDGTSNSISVPHSSSLNLSVPCSFSMWIKIPSYPTDGKEHYFMSKFSQGPGVSMKGFHMALSDYNNSDILFYRFRDDVNSNWGGNSLAYSSLPTVGTWFHIVLVSGLSSGQIYVNGNIISTSGASPIMGSNTASLLFGNGQIWDGNTMPFQGMMDDIGIYNRALTQQEVTNLYTSTLPPTLTATASPSLINCGQTATLTASSPSASQPCSKVDLPATLQNGLVGYWPFCGNANDASGNNNNGTVNGATLTTDRFGNANSAYSFDGLNDYIQVNDNVTLDITGNISISAWINTLVLNPNRIVDKTTVGQSDAYLIDLSGNPTDRIRFIVANSFNPQPQSAAGAISANEFIHVTVTYDQTNVRFFINGVLNLTYPKTGLSINNNNPLRFGANSLLNGNWFNGKIDDIAIYNRALSASEIQQLYTLGNVTYAWSTGATTPSITISPAQTTTYSCTATNTAGSTTSSVTVTVADTLTWTGTVDTDWHKACNWSPEFVPRCCNPVKIPLTANQPIVAGVAASKDITIQTTNGALLTVNNGANLQIQDCPLTSTTNACPSLAVLTTTAASSITQTTAVSGGTITYQGSSAITARGICWSTTPNPTLANSFSSNGTGTGTFTSNLTGLIAGTTYYVRAYATNSSGTSYGNQVNFVAVNPQPAYPTNSVYCTGTPTLVVDVTNPSTGKTWMDRNLGATQVATSSTDAAAYGDLYQWGRGNDGHQCRNSATTTTLSATDQPGHGNFILAAISPWDWRNNTTTNLWQGLNGINNPCPTGYRVPSESEWETERLSWLLSNSNGAINSNLKLTASGNKNYGNGIIYDSGVYGGYWSSTMNGSYSQRLSFFSGSAYVGFDYRAYGFSVRCIKN